MRMCYLETHAYTVKKSESEMDDCKNESKRERKEAQKREENMKN